MRDTMAEERPPRRESVVLLGLGELLEVVKDHPRRDSGGEGKRRQIVTMQKGRFDLADPDQRRPSRFANCII